MQRLVAELPTAQGARKGALIPEMNRMYFHHVRQYFFSFFFIEHEMNNIDKKNINYCSHKSDNETMTDENSRNKLTLNIIK